MQSLCLSTTYTFSPAVLLTPFEICCIGRSNSRRKTSRSWASSLVHRLQVSPSTLNITTTLQSSRSVSSDLHGGRGRCARAH